MKCKELAERACLSKVQGTLWDKSHLFVGILLAAILVFSLANCSAHRSPVQSTPTPPSPPAPSTPTAEKTTPAGHEESTEKSKEASGSQASSDQAAAAGNADSREASPKATGSESRSPSSSETTPAAGAAGAGKSPELEKGSAPSDGAATKRQSLQGAATNGQSPPGGPASTGAQTTEERTGNLDRKLESSLTEFDGILLKEQEILEERREASGGQSMGGGYGATGEEQSGSEVSEGQQAGEEDQEHAQDGSSGGSPDAPAGKAGEATPGESNGDDRAQKGSGRVPRDVGDGRDDDIVARQLREAAMKEDDPKLRAKLWDEYRKYKKGLK